MPGIHKRFEDLQFATFPKGLDQALALCLQGQVETTGEGK